MILHGTHSKYVNDHCRCDACTAAATEAVTSRRHERERYTEANGGPPSSVEHGISAFVNWGCRCDICSEARREYDRARYARSRR